MILTNWHRGAELIDDNIHRFIKNEAYNPASIDDDAIEEYIRSASQPGGLRSMFSICKYLVRWTADSTCAKSLQLLCWYREKANALIQLDRATEVNVKANQASAMTKLQIPVLAVGSKGFIGNEVEKQMRRVADRVTYRELDFGHQLAEECPLELARIYLEFLQNQ